ncbi:MAG: hypothetical protein U9O06_13960 [Euryarchaeota archaeon]|nr:hypothetical protein [Euryarchaeota archaeon]
MVLELLKREVDIPGSGLEPLFQHRFLTPPYGYVIGILLWPANISLLTVGYALSLSDLPSPVVTVGGVAVQGAFVMTSMISAVVMGLTAWNTPDERIQRHFVLLCLCLLLAALFFRLQHEFPTPLRFELGLGLSASNELSKIVFRGPALGFTSVVYALIVLSFRHLFK